MDFLFNPLSGKFDLVRKHGEMIVTAGETLSALKLIYIAADGKAHVGDPTASDKAQVIGITAQAGNLNDTINIITSGIVADPSFSFSAGAALFLSALGSLTATAPSNGYQTRVGHALDVGKVFIRIEETITL